VAAAGTVHFETLLRPVSARALKKVGMTGLIFIEMSKFIPEIWQIVCFTFFKDKTLITHSL
jgi:hypothetical protein